MDFNIDQTLKGMIDAGLGVLSNEAPAVKDCVTNVLSREKDALKKIADMRLGNQIDDDDLLDQLGKRKEVLEAGLLSCQVQAKVAAQQAINAALDVFQKAIKALIP